MDVFVPVFPNSESEISEMSHKDWSELCCGIFIMEVPEGVVLVVCSEPRRGDSTTE